MVELNNLTQKSIIDLSHLGIKKAVVNKEAFENLKRDVAPLIKEGRSIGLEIQNPDPNPQTAFLIYGIYIESE